MESGKQMERRPLCDGGDKRRCGWGKWVGVVLATAAGAAFLTMAPCACKQQAAPQPEANKDAGAPAVAPAGAPAADAATQEQKLPRLLDLGAHACIPCKMMAPILDELQKEYAGVFKTEFIDVWQKPDAGTQHGIQSIPTQIFFDATGKELYRHVGFISKEDILAKWKEFGVDLAAE